MIIHFLYTVLFLPMYLFAFVVEKLLYPKEDWTIWGIRTAWKNYWTPYDD